MTKLSSDHDAEIESIESELWSALNALENRDLIAVRQCIDRAKSSVVTAWQTRTIPDMRSTKEAS